MKKTIIYGTGDYGRKVYSLLTKYISDKDICFCRTGAQENEICEGRKVINADNLNRSNSDDAQIIIAIKNRKIVADIKKILTKKGFLPQQIVDIVSFFEDNLIPEQYKQSDAAEKYCMICQNIVDHFMPAGEKTELFIEKKIIGGGYRENVICPVCGSGDRERWQYYLIKHETDLLSESCRVLHIAPESSNYHMIHANPMCDYYTGDLQVGRAMHQVDLTNIQFCNAFFDYIIANHVFEHITDEKKMFDEIKRVMKLDGTLICSFPICMDEDTFEDPAYVSEDERLKYYGQKDHVRLYGKDYKQHIEKYGFSVEVKSPKDYFGEEEIEKYGFIRNDVILFCKKMDDSSERQ